MKNKITKSIDENIVDFIINHGGTLEDTLLPFMIEQGYTELEDFNSADNVILTDLLLTDNLHNIASKTNETFDIPVYSFNTSFSISFDA